MAVLACAAPAVADAVENGLVAFNTTAFPRTIATFDPLTSKVTVLPNQPPGESVHPAWSPDGQRLAFVHSPDAFGTLGHIYVINLDGSGLRRLTSDSTREDVNPTWSPDGSQIAFSSRRGVNAGAYLLYVKTVGSTAPPRRVLSVPGDVLHPAWSPDGTQIAFSVGAGPASGELRVTTPAGVGQTLLKTTTPIDDSAWSPDGERLAIASAPDTVRIASIDRFGGDPQPLLRLGRRVEALTWSPDGSQIAFSTFGGTDIAVIGASGASTTAKTLVAGQNPAWAPRPLPAASIPIDTEVAAANPQLVSFRPRGAPAGKLSTALIEGASFSVVRRTPSVVTLRIKPPDCSTAHARLRRRASRVRVTNGHYNVRNDHLIAASHETAYTVTETCRGSTVKVTEGLVIVRPRRHPNRMFRVRAGRPRHVAGRLR